MLGKRPALGMMFHDSVSVTLGFPLKRNVSQKLNTNKKTANIKINIINKKSTKYVWAVAAESISVSIGSFQKRII